MAYKITQHRRGTTQEWLELDLIPEDGELVIGSFSYYCDIYICKAEDYTGSENLIEIYRDAVANMDESVRFGENFKSKYEA